MTDAVAIAMIGAGSAVSLAAIPGLFAAFNARAARHAAERAKEAAERGELHAVETGKRVDGRMDEMLALTRKIAYQEGTAAEKLQGEALARAVKEASVPAVVVAPQPLSPEVQRQEKDSG